MPRFHFQVHDGLSESDLDGTELPTLAAARLEGVKLAGALLRDHAAAFLEAREWSMDVTDHAGLIQFSLTFFVSEAPVLLRELD